MTYGYAETHILPAMEIRDVRRRIVAERERLGLNQRDLASKAGIDQGHMSKIENIDGEPMRDLAARIVFQVIERGLEIPLSSFFAELEGRHVPSTTAQSVQPSPEQVTRADPVSKETSAFEALLVSNKKIAESLQEIAVAITVAAKPRRQTARPRTRKSASHKVRGKAG